MTNKMLKTQLTASESAKLIELGVSPGKANGLWLPGTDAIIPFALSDILDILPKEVKIHRDGDTLSMIYHCGQWRVGYPNCAEYCNHTKVAPELIDALYSLLVWCLEKGYVK